MVGAHRPSPLPIAVEPGFPSVTVRPYRQYTCCSHEPDKKHPSESSAFLSENVIPLFRGKVRSYSQQRLIYRQYRRANTLFTIPAVHIIIHPCRGSGGMADAHDLGSCGVIREGSSPSFPINYRAAVKPLFVSRQNQDFQPVSCS